MNRLVEEIKQSNASALDVKDSEIMILKEKIESQQQQIDKTESKSKCDFQADDIKSFLYHLTTEHLLGTDSFKCSDFLCSEKKSIKRARKF